MLCLFFRSAALIALGRIYLIQLTRKDIYTDGFNHYDTDLLTIIIDEGEHYHHGIEDTNKNLNLKLILK